MTINQRPATLAPQCRTVSLRLVSSAADQPEAAVDTDARTLTLAFASETPVDM